MRGQTVKGIAAVVIGAALMISIPANTARADDRTALRATPATYGSQHRQYYGKRDYGKRGFWRRKVYERTRRWHRPKRFSYRQWGQRCQPVGKVSRDYYGNKTIIGGTLCFNGNGESYIVPGSRYVVD